MHCKLEKEFCIVFQTMINTKALVVGVQMKNRMIIKNYQELKYWGYYMYMDGSTKIWILFSSGENNNYFTNEYGN